jgi:hypothetical protein
MTRHMSDEPGCLIFALTTDVNWPFSDVANSILLGASVQTLGKCRPLFLALTLDFRADYELIMYVLSYLIDNTKNR